MSSFNFRQVIAPVAITLFGLLQSSQAQEATPASPTSPTSPTFYVKSATLMSSVPGDVTVGYASKEDFVGGAHGTSPTLRLLKGADIVGILVVCNKSRVNINGGIVEGQIFVNDSSILNVRSGTLNKLVTAVGNGSINISGGSIKGEITLQTTSTINVYGTKLRKTLASMKALGGGYRQYTLSGNLSDGSDASGIKIDLIKGGSAKLNIINAAPPAAQ